MTDDALAAIPPPDDIGAQLPKPLADFALEWLHTVGDTSFVEWVPATKAALFTEWTHILARAAKAGGDRQAAYDVGVAMVKAQYSTGETLAGTVGMLDRQLRAELGLADDEGARRLRMVLEGLVTGYARTVRDQSLDEQDALRVAALQASHKATEELRKERERAEHAALHDALTGLPNRAHFERELDRFLRKAADRKRVGVCVFGLDRFRQLNHSLGHAAGDQFLVSVARRLRVFADEAGALAARLDGDTFAVLLTDTAGPEQAIKVADGVLTALRHPIYIDEVELPAQASAGVVERAVLGADTADVLRAADLTLHWAKTDGRGRWCLFDEQRNKSDLVRYALSTQLPRALSEKQFFLEYQPLVRLHPDEPGRYEVYGVEALVRWKHPRRGIIKPDEFVSLAEETGLMVPLGRHLLDQACREGVGWHAVGPHPPLVSVNLSVCQLRSPGFAAGVLQVLDESSLPPDKLQLEITERVAMATDEESLKALRQLAEHGVILALDDYGTGNANLAYLRDLPIKEVKIAGKFAQGIAAGDHADEAIVRSTIMLAHELGQKVTAEGVQDEAAACWLAQEKCDHAQGFLFYRPMLADGITQMLSKGRG